MDLQGTILGVSPRTSRDGSKQMWDVAFSDGNSYTTFDGSDAALASSLLGQQGTTLRVSMNGKYKNLDGIAAPGQGLQGGPTMAPGTQFAAGAPVVAVGTSVEQERMSFYGALKNAVPLVAALYQGAGPESLDDAVEAVKTLTARFQAGAKAAEQGITAAGNGHVPQTPAEVVEQVNAQAGTEVIAQGAPAVDW